MHPSYRRYSGAHGFTSQQFAQTAKEVAGADLRGWLKQTVSSPLELDYTEALDWYGLQFAGGQDAKKKWRLEVRGDATPAQQARLQRLLESTTSVH